LRVDLDWRDAQLGQLSRLLVGSDADWRGDLTGNLHLEGTPDAANVTARLRAEGVHRAEFAPAAPLDFDANCSLVYHYSRRALENLVCDSPLGDGHMRLTGGMPGADAPPNASLELDRIPVGAGLDMLRTMRSGIDSDLQAAGTISGKLAYSGTAQAASPKAERPVHTRKNREIPSSVAQEPLTGSFTVDGFAVSGGGLDQPLRASKFTLAPIEIGPGERNAVPAGEGIAGTMTIPAGGDAPLTVNLRLALYGYEAIVHGQASIARARQIGKLAGTPDTAALDGLAGDPLTANLTVEGPWVPGEVIAGATTPGASPSAGARTENVPGPVPTDFDRGLKPAADTISGTVALHNANWHADYLASQVQIANATLHLDENAMRWDPVEFSYGPVKGSLRITAPVNCAPPEGTGAAAEDKCAPQFEAQFGALDAETLQAAFLGARQKGTLLSDLIDRLHTASITPWPAMNGTIRAESLALGPVTLRQPSATVKISPASADFSALTATTLGGQVNASGTVSWAAGDQAAPGYSISAQFAGLSAAAVGQLLAARWTGGPINVDGKVDLSGFSAEDLAASAKGQLHFDWKHGGMAGQGNASAGKANGDSEQAMPVRFGEWSGDATIEGGAITLGESHLIAGGRKLAIQGAITFVNPQKVDLKASPSSEQKSR
jgi:hypothetical protein